MSKIIQYLLYYVTNDFKWKFYLVFILFLMGSVFMNYQFHWWGGKSFQNYMVVPHYGKWSEPVMFGLFHSVPYLIAVLLLKVFNYPIRLTKGFWAAFAFAFFLIGIRRGTDYYQSLSSWFDPQDWQFLRSFVYNIYTLLIMFIPLWLMYKLKYKKGLGHFYGIQIKGVKFGPYWLMLLGMVPLIVGASFSASFLEMYPTYSVHRGNEFALHHSINSNWSFWIYEFAYIIDYASIEVFYRGFLIFIMVKYLGRHAILPMVAAYVWLHFGKPLGETIGSAFGGYILGITALYSRNIWGGIFIHMGVAFLMDVFAFWQL